MEFHHQHMSIDIEVRPLYDRGLLLFMGNRDGNSFLSLSLQGGVLELRLASGRAFYNSVQSSSKITCILAVPFNCVNSILQQVTMKPSQAISIQTWTWYPTFRDRPCIDRQQLMWQVMQKQRACSLSLLSCLSCIYCQISRSHSWLESAHMQLQKQNFSTFNNLKSAQWSSANVLPIPTKADGFLRAKICSIISFGRDVNLGVLCHTFTACKRTFPSW